MKKEKALKILSEIMGEYVSRLVHGPDDEYYIDYTERDYTERLKERVEAIRRGMTALDSINEKK